MKPFSPSKRKLIELVILVVLAGIFYIFYPKIEGVILFVFGFIWNWCASIELDPIYENRRYRFSMLTTVRNIQKLFLKPFLKLPVFVQRIVKVFPAGIFWWMVVYINQSDMPWWAPFLGSASFEILQIELKMIKDHKGQA
jgi:hypothetical protein